MTRFCVFAVALLVPVLANAHVDPTHTGGFLSGVLHPVSGLDHALAMVAVGLWGSQLGKPAVWVLPVTFPLVMAFGGFLGVLGLPFPWVESGIALSAIILGLFVLLCVRLPLWAALPAVGAFALFHGYAHGAELPAGGNEFLYSLGFVIATGLLHALGIAIGLFNRFRFGALAVRGLGGIVLLAGGWFLLASLS